jgi:cysteinyl-tRNA synthetase
MSKSLGNFVTIQQVLGENPGDVARFNMLRTHYRQPFDWLRRSLNESFNTFTGWVRLLDAENPSWRNLEPAFEKSVLAALSDDLNTPLAITELHKLVGGKKYEELAKSLLAFGFSGDIREHILEDNINRKIEARLTARKAKDFKESDRIRDELAANGIALKDNPDGTTSWEVKR